MRFWLTRKNERGLVTVYPIIGLVLVGLIGAAVALRVLPQRNARKNISPQVPQSVQLRGESLENKGCNLTIALPESWDVAFNNEGIGEYKNDKWEGRCMIGVKSGKVDAPFSLLINESAPTKTLAEYQQDLLESERRNIGLRKYTQDRQILGNSYTVRFDETEDKGFLTTYFLNDSIVIELYGFYLMNDPSTKSELLQILSSLKSLDVD